MQSHAETNSITRLTQIAPNSTPLKRITRPTSLSISWLLCQIAQFKLSDEKWEWKFSINSKRHNLFIFSASTSASTQLSKCCQIWSLCIFRTLDIFLVIFLKKIVDLNYWKRALIEIKNWQCKCHFQSKFFVLQMSTMQSSIFS